MNLSGYSVNNNNPSNITCARRHELLILVISDKWLVLKKTLFFPIGYLVNK